MFFNLNVLLIIRIFLIWCLCIRFKILLWFVFFFIVINDFFFVIIVEIGCLSLVLKCILWFVIIFIRLLLVLVIGKFEKFFFFESVIVLVIVRFVVIVIGKEIIFVLYVFILCMFLVCFLIVMFLWMKFNLFFCVKVIVKWVFVIVFIDVEISGKLRLILCVKWVEIFVVCGKIVEWFGIKSMLLKVRVFLVIFSIV